jgi:hypothetical protein
MNFWLNWKTNSAGIVSMLVALVDIITSLLHKTQPNWQLDLAAIVTGLGLLFAKDGTTSSTQPEVDAATKAANEKTLAQINK